MSQFETINGILILLCVLIPRSAGPLESLVSITGLFYNCILIQQIQCVCRWNCFSSNFSERQTKTASMQSLFSSPSKNINSPPRCIITVISIPVEFAEHRETRTVWPFTCKNNAGGVEKCSCWKESAMRFHMPLNTSIQHSWVPL